MPTKPASGTGLDSGNALFSKFKNVWAFLEGSGTTSADSKSSNTLTLDTSALWASDAVGPKIVSSAAGHHCTPGTTVSLPTTAQTDYGFAWGCSQLNADNQGMVCGHVQSTDFFIWMNGGVISFRDVGGTEASWTPTTITAMHDYVLSLHFVSSGSGWTASLYEDGSLISTQAYTPAGAISNFTLTDILRGYNNSGFDFIGTLEYLYTFDNYAPSSTDAANLHTNPYSIFLASAPASLVLPASTIPPSILAM